MRVPVPPHRGQEGFGLVELLIAMTILTVAAFTILAAFSSGLTALQRAARTTTAATLADADMERMRAIRYCDIWLTAVPDGGLYAADAAYNGGAQVELTSCTGAPPEPAIPASVERPGADGRTYRVDTYVVEGRPRDAGGEIEVSRPVKTVTLVVRDPASSLRILTRQSSTFDESTGLSPAAEDPEDGG
jgi:hypothetical protein